LFSKHEKAGKKTALENNLAVRVSTFNSIQVLQFNSNKYLYSMFPLFLASCSDVGLGALQYCII